jgi:hypothetical protein
MTKQKSNERCPCCDREIKWFRDYPLMQVLAVSVIKPEEVPALIVSGHPSHNDLKEKEVPAEVKTYFTSNPDTQQYAHSDGFVYERFVFPTDPRHRKQEISWSRSPNLSSEIRRNVESNPSLKSYLTSLEGMVGKTLPTIDFMRQFGPEGEEGQEPRQIAPRLYVLFSEDEAGEGSRSVRFELGANPMEMGRLHSEKLYSIVLNNLASVKYVGKLLK